MIKAVIFDIFGVLTIDAWLKFCEVHLQDLDKREQAKELNRETDLGLLTYPDFLNRIEQLSGVPAKEIDAQIYERLPKNEQLLNYIKDELKPNYKVAILSNISNHNWVKQYFTKDELNLFDTMVLSIDAGVIKPDPRIFQLVLKKLDVKPEETVFIDDRQKNVDKAKELGMGAVFYKDFDQMQDLLKQLLDGKQ